MKIGILTQPLFFNYGGILQAYSLQTTLEQLGHTVAVLNREPAYVSSRFPNGLKINFKYYLKKVLRRNNFARNTFQNKLLRKNTSIFINNYLHLSPSLYTDYLLKKYFKKGNFDCVIVGSDQVWRPSCSPKIYNYFLDFCQFDEIVKIAYAASFGVDAWEFSQSQTTRCKSLVTKFNGVSVREQSGVSLCEKYLDIKATHVLDPTMLLNKADYIDLINNSTVRIPKIKGSLFCYILDSNLRKQSIIDIVSSKTGYEVFKCYPKYGDSPASIEKHGKECVYPPVEQWLASFKDAEMVITDSFHGTAFSIIFNKPFWVIGNVERGMARFNSLLKMFNLENRLILTDQMEELDFEKKINWEEVNRLREQWKTESLKFLNKYLM